MARLVDSSRQPVVSAGCSSSPPARPCPVRLPEQLMKTVGLQFHFMGGGWCNDAKGCAGRGKSLLGSSTFWTPKLSDLWNHGAGFYGLMSATVNQTGDEVGNPFGDWNFVWLAYCDVRDARNGPLLPLSTEHLISTIGNDFNSLSERAFHAKFLRCRRGHLRPPTESSR